MLTLYAFSRENWKRPAREVKLLMRLLRRFLVRERKEIMKNDIRLTSIGRLHRLPADVLRELKKTEELSKDNKGTTLCLALSYGGRQELLDGFQKIAQKVAAGNLNPEEVSEELITEAYLSDLLKRKFLRDGVEKTLDTCDRLVRRGFARRLGHRRSGVARALRFDHTLRNGGWARPVG